MDLVLILDEGLDNLKYSQILRTGNAWGSISALNSGFASGGGGWWFLPIEEPRHFWSHILSPGFVGPNYRSHQWASWRSGLNDEPKLHIPDLEFEEMQRIWTLLFHLFRNFWKIGNWKLKI